MVFSLPLALIALIPWAILAWRLGRSAGQAARVPFLALWPSDAAATAARRRRLPSWPIVLILVGLLLAILAAAGPGLTLGPMAGSDLTILLDRGNTMSTLESGQTRLERAMRGHDALLSGLTGVHVISIPPDPSLPETVDDAAWQSLPAPTPTADDTKAELQGAVTTQRRAGRRVLIFSDRELSGFATDEAVLRVDVPEPSPNVAIERLAVDGPSPRTAVVTVRTHAERLTADGTIPLRIETGLGMVRHQLPRSEGEETFTVDLPPGEGPVTFVLVRFDVPLGWPGDDFRVVVANPPPHRIVVGEELPEPVERLLGLLTEAAPASEAAPPLLVTRDSLALQTAGIQLAVGPFESPADGAGQVTAADVPFLAGLDGALIRSLPFSPSPPSGGAWRPVLLRNGQTLVAVRDDPRSGRQVWIGFSASFFADEPAFVRFWMDLVEWVRGGPLKWSAPMADEGITRLPPAAAVEAAVSARVNLPALAPGRADGVARPDDVRSFVAASGRPLELAWMLTAAALAFVAAGAVGVRLTKRG